MPVFQLTRKIVFPPPELADDDGLLAVGGDLSTERLLLAYSMGIFPWYSDMSPILWWSPDPRLVLFPEMLRVSRSLRQCIRKGLFSVTFDRAFDDVILKCALVHRAGKGDTWITDEMIDAYRRLHREGFAHSVEAWKGQDLAGGIYGVSLGAAFFGESMFTVESNASKVALVELVQMLSGRGFKLIDCQMKTEHLLRFGASEISRSRFLALLKEALRSSTWRGSWSAGSAGNDATGDMRRDSTA